MFEVAERELDIPALLDPLDMAECSKPDRLSILTYLAEFYHKFKTCDLDSPAKQNTKLDENTSTVEGSSSELTRKDSCGPGSSELRRKDSCDSGVSVSPSDSQCNSPLPSKSVGHTNAESYIEENKVESANQKPEKFLFESNKLESPVSRSGRFLESILRNKMASEEKSKNVPPKKIPSYSKSFSSLRGQADFDRKSFLSSFPKQASGTALPTFTSTSTFNKSPSPFTPSSSSSSFSTLSPGESNSTTFTLSPSQFSSKYFPTRKSEPISFQFQSATKDKSSTPLTSSQSRPFQSLVAMRTKALRSSFLSDACCQAKSLPASTPDSTDASEVSHALNVVTTESLSNSTFGDISDVVNVCTEPSDVIIEATEEPLNVNEKTDSISIDDIIGPSLRNEPSAKPEEKELLDIIMNPSDDKVESSDTSHETVEAEDTTKRFTSTAQVNLQTDCNNSKQAFEHSKASTVSLAVTRDTDVLVLNSTDTKADSNVKETKSVQRVTEEEITNVAETFSDKTTNVQICSHATTEFKASCPNTRNMIRIRDKFERLSVSGDDDTNARDTDVDVLKTKSSILSPSITIIQYQVSM